MPTERRGSAMYDPARDVFHKEDAPAEDEASSASTKRKRASSEAVASESPEHRMTSSPKRTKTSPKPDSAKPNAATARMGLPKDALTGKINKRKAPADRDAAPAPLKRVVKPRRDGEAPRVTTTTGRRAARTPPRRDPSPRSPSPIPDSPPREYKRAAPAPRNQAQVEAAKRRVAEREEAERRDAQKAAAERQGIDVVSSHYNAVPQRGREWRQTGSKIKGLRSFNNWCKSALIQKFSPSPGFSPGAREQGQHLHEGLKVLDIGCGKGGDLQKWQAAPQPVAVYFGLDPASISVDQARQRHRELIRNARNFRNKRDQRAREFLAEFWTRDCFGSSLGEIPAIRSIGFDHAVGPGSNYNPHASGGFDVVTMMFCLHYAFENEQRARQMLKNVAGALKKGGRFIGVIPNSKVLTERIMAKGKAPANGTKSKISNADTLNYDEEDDWNPEKPAEDGEDNWDPEKPTASGPPPADDSDDDWDPEKPSNDIEDVAAKKDPREDEQPLTEPTPAEPIEWGNDIYHVKYPGSAPKDGIWRPMYGWKYFFFLDEAVDEVPEYIVPWEGFRALALEYNLELQISKPLPDMWEDYRNDHELRFLSQRMKVVDEDGRFNVSEQEMEASGFYSSFCFYKV